MAKVIRLSLRVLGIDEEADDSGIVRHGPCAIHRMQHHQSSQARTLPGTANGEPRKLYAVYTMRVFLLEFGRQRRRNDLAQSQGHVPQHSGGMRVVDEDKSTRYAFIGMLARYAFEVIFKVRLTAIEIFPVVMRAERLNSWCA